MEAIKAKIKGLATSMVKEVIAGLANDFRDSADVALSVALDELQTRIPEADFISFCESL
jgi:hypothetical protein